MKRYTEFRFFSVGRLLAAIVMVGVVAAWTATAGQRVAIAQEGRPMPTAEATPAAGPVMMSLQAVPSYGRAPLTVGFFVNTVGLGNVQFRSYRWNFGDGHVSTVPPPFTQNTYTKAGSYTVTVTAVTTKGRTVTAFTGVIVRPPR